MPSFGKLPLIEGGSFATNSELIADRFDWALSRFEKLGGEPPLVTRCRDFVECNRDVPRQCARASVTHFDLHPANILFSRDDAGALALSGVIDWESAFAADPLMDVAQAFHRSARRDTATLGALASGYGELRPGWRRAFNLYLLYFSIELWVWFVKGGSAPPHRGIERRIGAICND